MVNFKEIYHFSRFQKGSNFFQGWSNCLFPIETHINCDFPGRGGGPDPPLWCLLLYLIWSIMLVNICSRRFLDAFFPAALRFILTVHVAQVVL